MESPFREDQLDRTMECSIRSHCRKEKKIIIKLYKNGFMVNNEPFMSKSASKENEEMYQGIIEGYVPKTLEKLVEESGISVVVEDRREEMYATSSSRFSGKANRMVSSMYTPFFCKLTL